ncbi:hypothetical protein G6L37_04215 [Agrobacterium rubi]|nr:hypothetical protein [Agrobacterium rubi]NTF24556.1 hypothetical protein [Agrobacterium rubi]
MWEKIDAEAQRAIDDLILESRTELKAAGFPARGSRFPFGMHHEFYRVRIRIGRRKSLQSEIANMLNLWMAGRDNRLDYGRQAVCGAVKSMLATHPELAGRIPGSVRALMSAVGNGYEFLNWAKAAVSASPDQFVHEQEVVDRDQMIDELIEAVSA